MKNLLFAIIITSMMACGHSTRADELPAFQLADSNGETYEFSVTTASQFTVVCFLGTECPLARLYGARLSGMSDEFANAGVQFLGINSNRQDSMSDIRNYAKKHDITFPLFRDPGNRVADQFQATRTPEVFVLNRALEVVYQGRIDDQYAPGISRNKPNRRDLHAALTELISGKPVSVDRTQAVGCLIGRVSEESETATNDITWSEHVVPVIHRHCIGCHREGDIGPFAMEQYDEVAGWADTMMETIDDGRMPPWHANPQFGEFRNARAMPEEDRQVLRDWIAGGLKQGDLSRAPAVPPAVSGWALSREPELVVAMRDRPFHVPAEGTVEYQYFVTDPGFTDDRWIVEAQTLPGNRSVVHHIIIFIRPPTLSQFRGVGWLTAYVPGQRTVQLPPGRARLVPAGSKLVFQMHYTPNGESQEDLSRIGMVFADSEDVTHEVYTLAAVNQEFEIPPGAADYVVEASVRRVPNDGELLSITPHMHYRGKTFRVVNGESADAPTLLDIPGYDFNWQHTYELVRPLPFSEVDRLKFFATFDNSKANPFNPDANEWVTWGDQTWEEMAIAFFDVSEPVEKSDGSVRQAKEAIADTGRQLKVDAYVKRFFETLDRDHDGQVKRSEVSIVMRRRTFDRIDSDSDGILTRDEVTATAESIYPKPLR